MWDASVVSFLLSRHGVLPKQLSIPESRTDLVRCWIAGARLLAVQPLVIARILSHLAEQSVDASAVGAACNQGEASFAGITADSPELQRAALDLALQVLPAAASEFGPLFPRAASISAGARGSNPLAVRVKRHVLAVLNNVPAGQFAATDDIHKSFHEQVQQIGNGQMAGQIQCWINTFLLNSMGLLLWVAQANDGGMRIELQPQAFSLLPRAGGMPAHAVIRLLDDGPRSVKHYETLFSIDMERVMLKNGELDELLIWHRLQMLSIQHRLRLDSAQGVVATLTSENERISGSAADAAQLALALQETMTLRKLS